MRTITQWFFLVALLPVLFTACAKQEASTNRTDTVVPDASESTHGIWTYMEDIDPGTGAVTRMIGSPSVTDGRTMLALQNINDEILMSFYWGSFLYGNENNQIAIRFCMDDAVAWSPPVPAQLGSGNQCVYFSQDYASALVEALMEHSHVSFQVTDMVDGETITGTFSANGFREACARLIK